MTDPDRSAHAILTTELELIGFVVLTAGTGAEGAYLAAARSPDLVVLAQRLPDLGYRIALSRIRAVHTGPVVLAAEAVAQDVVVTAFEAGVDDVVGKPLNVPVVVARIKALLRRVALDRESGNALRVGSLEIDPRSRRVVVGDREVELTRLEFDLLVLLAGGRGRVVKREAVLSALWGEHADAGKRLDVHVAALRRKLGENAARPRFLHTVKRVGFRFGEEV
ncbi:response regulator transcription factor [Lentzea sp. NBRC 102530]|uniref:response regulator transcription factor n=1 Tax=Lentzea sp. NBRC 102530 TaxID=3032201 RepID=UPI0024A1542A|nr:response regulator transcription factor [Lentzea sp. NBRC 102530]GLY46838.1 DNA-binding response regulator [Lentzea sp. NBRC 102530]